MITVLPPPNGFAKPMQSSAEKAASQETLSFLFHHWQFNPLIPRFSEELVFPTFFVSL